MLEGKKIYFRYKKNMPWVLANAEIGIHPGEIVGLSGYSGQGKTTLGKIPVQTNLILGGNANEKMEVYV